MTSLQSSNSLSGYLLRGGTFDLCGVPSWALRHSITPLRLKSILKEAIRERFIERADVGFILIGADVCICIPKLNVNLSVGYLAT